MRLFIVSSVYQFINALTVQLNDRSVPSDILCVMSLLDNTFDLEKFREEKIFEKVYVWTGEIERFHMDAKNKKEAITNAVKKVSLALGKKKLLSELPALNKHYDEICISYPDYPSRLACHALKDKDTACTLLEDGTFTYDFFAQKQSALKATAFKLLVGSDVIPDIKKIYVYRPEMLRLGEHKAEVVKIRSELDELGAIIRRVYKHELPQIDLIDKPVIMFDQNVEDEVVTSNQCAVAKAVTRVLGEDSFVVKMHPHSKVNPYDESIAVYKAKCPFEILMSALNMENKVLISLLSTACMNPKMILDAEPTVIFTVKLSGVERSSLYNEGMLKLLESFKSSYRDPEKIYIPESFEELDEILQKIKIG